MAGVFVLKYIIKHTLALCCLLKSTLISRLMFTLEKRSLLISLKGHRWLRTVHLAPNIFHYNIFPISIVKTLICKLSRRDQGPHLQSTASSSIGFSEQVE